MIKTNPITGLLWLFFCSSMAGLCTNCNKAPQNAYYFPPPGNHISHHDKRQPGELGLNPKIIEEINDFFQENPYMRGNAKYDSRWAIWRNGCLIHVEGDFYKKANVASLRKTWHAMILGAAIQKDMIKDENQKISKYLPELKGLDAEATWKDVLTQSAGFDYPYDTFPDYKPGEMWTYSDLNLVHLCNALARLHGKKNYYDDFDEVADQAYFDAIGMKGWETAIVRDASFGNRNDGVRFVLNMEHMGRLGLLALARGEWNGRQLIPKSFVESLETKQTRGMKVNYNGPNDGTIEYDEKDFPESPFGYFTWTNTDGDLYKGANKYWANGSGAGGSKILWNKTNGIVLVGFGLNLVSDTDNVPLIIERNIVDGASMPKNPVAKIGQWSSFEVAVEIDEEANPYQGDMLTGIFSDPEGKTTMVRGFYDGYNIWKTRFMPSLTGTYHYQLVIKNGKTVKEGIFEAQTSDIPGLINKYKENPIWFGYRNGKPVLIRSFHLGDRFTADTANTITGEPWNKNQRTRVLNFLQQQGYNTLSIASLFLNRNSKGRGEGWDTPDLWDSEKQQPNYIEYRRLEKILDDLSVRKLLVYPFAGFLGRESDFPADDAGKRLFLEYTINRIGSYWNILYMVGGPEPLLKSNPFMTFEQVNYWGKTIDSLDVYNHLLGCHNYTGDELFQDQPWTDYGILQGPKTVDREKLYKLLLKNHHDEKPLYAQETLWPGNMYHPDYSIDDIRKNAFVLQMAASMVNFADMEGNSSSGFSGTMDFMKIKPEIHKEINRIWDFFEELPFPRMRPLPGVADNGFCLAEPGEQYLIYLPEGGKINIVLPDQHFSAQWIDPKDTAIRQPAGVVSGKQALMAPDSNDWLLLLTRSKPQS